MKREKLKIDGKTVTVITHEKGDPLPFEITVAPAPKTDKDCCRVDAGRCRRHATMMREIRTFVDAATTDADLDAVTAECDGYGEKGFMPGEWDWSGIRDSSAEAVEAMHKVVVDRRKH